MSIDVHKKFWPRELHTRVLNWPRKSLSRSEDNRQGKATLIHGVPARHSPGQA